MGISQNPAVAQILKGTVMHARLVPRRNAFRYGIYYIALSLSRLEECTIAQERFGLSSFYRKDHGPCDGSPLLPWARDVLKKFDSPADGEIVLICMPRILGYVFNPVSFWICYDQSQAIRAIICEVRNTFGERHSYFCARADHGPITAQYTITSEKIFHVSPFLQREGHYEFVFDIQDKTLDIKIDYYNAQNQKTLLTSLRGDFSALTPASLRQVFWQYPLITLKAIGLIHWQALKIILKGIPYVPKPLQNSQKLSASENITEI
jgi:DUF1365 family protein